MALPAEPTMQAGADLVPRILEEYGNLTRVALCEYLGPREPRRYLYNLVADYPRRGGRMLRPSLLLATAVAFGGRVEDALPAAAGLELLHNAFLVHDDIEDDSQKRRGDATLHEKHGVAIALNTGDALTHLGMRAMADSARTLRPHLAQRLLREADRMITESLEGQAIELGWRRDNPPSLDLADYLNMVLKKTCWYTTIFPLRAGALIGSRGRFDLDRLTRFGFFLGAAFQIQDDLLNLDAYSDEYGKESCGDIYEGKRTVMLIALLRALGGDERARLLDFLQRDRGARDLAEIRAIRTNLDRHGCTERARQIAHALAGVARAEWHQMGVRESSSECEFIAHLPTWVLSRT